MADVRILNRTGIARFRAYLRQLRAGAVTPPPVELLDNPATTEELPQKIEMEARAFRNRLELGAYLNKKLAPLSAEVTDRNKGLWTWLALFWFDQTCPVRMDGSRRPGRDYRHIPEFSYRRQHSHLLLGPSLVFRRHGYCSLALLSGPTHEESRIYHEITGRRDLIANRGVIEAALHLYVDARRGTIKRGAHGTSGARGTVRRFVRVLQQLDLTYDIYGLSGRELVKLLPAEFDIFRPTTLFDERPPA